MANLPKTWNSLLAVKYDTSVNEIEFIPIINQEKGITLAKGEEYKSIMQDFFARNEELQNGEWKKGWHAFCENASCIYINAIKNACNDDSTESDNALFAHYLDCEAHTDVWRELFPTYNKTNEVDI